MTKYTIHFVYWEPSSEFFNYAGKVSLGLNSPIRKIIAKGTCENEENALYECNYIVGGDLKFEKEATFYSGKGKCKYYSKHVGKSSFEVKIKQE